MGRSISEGWPPREAAGVRVNSRGFQKGGIQARQENYICIQVKCSSLIGTSAELKGFYH
jgi:hypothetical protein